MKKLLILFLSICTCTLLLISESNHTNSNTKKKIKGNIIESALEKKSQKTLPFFDEIPQKCLRKIEYNNLSYLLKYNNKANIREVFSNWHIKNKNDEIIRLRIFREDTDNGSYRKLVLYKEDKTGFPRIIETPKEDQRSPSKATLKKYLNKGHVIYHQEAYEVQEMKEADIYWEKIDNKLMRLSITTSDNQVDCRLK